MNKNKSEKGKILALASISVCIIAVAIAGATGVSEAVEATSTPLSGELAIAGSTTVLPINQECARLLMDENPGLIISVSGGGSGHGVKAVGRGEIDIGAASRDIKSKEWEKYPDLKPVAIGKDSVAIVVHPNNDVSDLTIENVSKIFAGEIKNWKELGGADAPIRIITREEGSGTREVFEKYVMKPFGREIAEEASVKSSNGVVRATVGRDEKSIGFLSLGYVDPSVKALKIDGVEATVKNILSGDYPIVRTLYLITKGEPEPLEKAFIDFVLSEEGQKVVEDSGYIKLAGAPKRNIITILHTNDVHAHLDNIARRATAVQEVRDEIGADNAFLLDAGDVFTGTLYFSLYRGMADMEFMNMLGYDSMCLGNHEFDNFATRPEDLTNFVDNASFPILSANFNFSDEPKLAGKIEPWVIIEKGGEQYGIFGLTTEDTAVISSPGESITINDHTATAEEVVAALEDQGINKIIALTHLGWNEDIALAQEVEGIDIIVGGHSDTVPDPYPTVINGDEPVIVVQAGGHGEYLGRLDVAFDADGVIQTYSGELLEVEMFDEDPEYAAKLAEYQKAIEELMETVVGETLVDLDGERAHVRTRETNLGNLITDAMLAKASCVNATIAIQNGGGIRASIPAGNITLGKLMEVQPFGNYLAVFNLSGEQIIAALENGVSKVEEVSGRFPQVAGLRYTWDPSKNREERIISVDVKTAADGYQPIDPLASYRIVTNNFLYSGGDGYMMFQNGTDFVLLGFVDCDVLREYIEENSPVSPEVEGRILLTAEVGGDILVGRAALPAYTFAPGPTSGQFIGEGPINGVLPPFIEKQPVQGFSAVLKKENDSFYAMSDNGFGSQGNSQDYVLRIYEVRPEFETAADGSGTIEVESFITLHDSDELIPFTIIADLDEYPVEGTAPKDGIPSGISVDPAIKEGRLLTGADFDIESIQQIEDGTFWIGDEFGPFLLHVDAEGKVLESPIPLPNVSSPQNPYLEDPADANLPRSRGFEGMALSVDGSRLYPMLEGALITDPDQTRRIINEFDLSSKSYIGNPFYYRMEDPTHAIGDFIAINEYEFLVIERDGSQRDLNGFKKIFRVDLSNLDSDGFVEKVEVVDLLNISDPDLISLPADTGDIGLGDPFAFPFVTIEDVVIIDSSTLGVLNDNNYPFSTGRKPN